MRILLLRHMESEKNVTSSLSTSKNEEQLTVQGEKDAKKTAKWIKEYIEAEGLIANHIYSASSKRAVSSAEYIASEIDASIVKDSCFLSVTTDKELMGKTEQEVRAINPTFYRELQLYRCGLFNAYNFSTVSDFLKSGAFERRVFSRYNDYLDSNDETMKIFIMHHSSITATLINIARHSFNYPENYYGRVEAAVGHYYMLDYVDGVYHILESDAAAFA